MARRTDSHLTRSEPRSTQPSRPSAVRTCTIPSESVEDDAEAVLAIVTCAPALSFRVGRRRILGEANISHSHDVQAVGAGRVAGDALDDAGAIAGRLLPAADMTEWSADRPRAREL